MPGTVIALVVIAIITTLVVFQNQTSSSSTNAFTVLTSYTTQSGEGPQEGMIAPDFTVRTLDGEEFSLSEFRGRKVVLWFMAVWCPSCAVVGPIIRDNQDQDTVVIVVDMWTEPILKDLGLLNKPGAPPPETGKDLTRFIDSYGSDSWLLVLDNYGLTKLYQLRYVDTTFVIGSDGRIILRSDGPVSSTLLRYALQKAAS
ncbi:MAG: TlpA family protein disulfide reductase [Aigarchaeota archaeon]|nr:TlpA family protein disulfide reductase [Candidatus Pelearchaeum maunauluense]